MTIQTPLQLVITIGIIALVIVVHKWRHNLLLSIVGGTVLYMLLVQLVFPVLA